MVSRQHVGPHELGCCLQLGPSSMVAAWATSLHAAHRGLDRASRGISPLQGPLSTPGLPGCGCLPAQWGQAPCLDTGNRSSHEYLLTSGHLHCNADCRATGTWGLQGGSATWGLTHPELPNFCILLSFGWALWLQGQTAEFGQAELQVSPSK